MYLFPCLIESSLLPVLSGVLSVLALLIVIGTAVACTKRKKKNIKGIKLYSDPYSSDADDVTVRGGLDPKNAD